VANDTLAAKATRNEPLSQAQDPLTAAVERTLRDFLNAEIALLEDVDPALGTFARTVCDVLNGGKRLRPTFAYWGWRGLVGSPERVTDILPALAALELMHAFALVHDDVMDASATRRGRPTTHRVFAAQHRGADRRGDPDHFGDAAAVLAGDLCLVWADQLLARTELPSGTLFAARSCYDRMRVEAVAGQYLDILGDAEPAAWSLDRALLVARHKTASYTVQRPLLFGAALADRRRCCGGVCRGERHSGITGAYQRYGLAVGEAFQLRDDLLGAFGDPAVTGKPAGDDLRTGKPTALLMLARTMATPRQRASLDRPGDIGQLGATIRETGAPAQVEELIRRRVQDGVAALAEAPIDAAARTALTDLAVAATHRPA
jgi:geranylgeranyl diphosphate synthase type I